MKTRSILISVCVCVVVLLLLVTLLGRGEKGSISVEGNGATLRLSGGLFNSVTLRPGSEPREVSAREYVPKWLTLAVASGNDTWRLQCTGQWGKLAEINVEKNQTTVVKLGPPLLIKPETTVNSSAVSVGLGIFGQAGEKYRNVITVNGAAMSEPKVQIIDQDGNVLASGRFEYG